MAHVASVRTLRSMLRLLRLYLEQSCANSQALGLFIGGPGKDSPILHPPRFPLNEPNYQNKLN